MARRRTYVSRTTDGNGPAPIGDINGIGDVPNGSDGTPVNAGSGDGAGPIVIDPASVGGPAGGDASPGSDGPPGSGGRRRGRPRGSRNAKASALDINGIEQILLSGHAMLAAMLKTPELMLDKAEATALATGVSNVARHYDLSATQKTLDWINLGMIVGTTYGARLLAISIRTRTEKARARENRQAAPGSNGAAPFMVYEGNAAGPSQRTN